MPPRLHPLPPVRPDVEPESWRETIDANFAALARDVEALRSQHDEYLVLARAMRDQCVRLADEVLAVRKATLPEPPETCSGVGPHRERPPTLPEIVSAIQTGQHQRVDSMRIDDALSRANDRRDAAILRKMKRTGWRLVLGAIGVFLGVLATGAGGYFLGKLLEHK